MWPWNIQLQLSRPSGLVPVEQYQPPDQCESHKRLLSNVDPSVGESFQVHMQRGEDTTTCYVVVLIDGAVTDHFLIDETRKNAASFGWQKDAYNSYPFMWTPRPRGKRKPIRLEGRLPNRHVDVSLLGYVTVRMYHLPDTSTAEPHNFMPHQTKFRYNRPSLYKYAIIAEEPMHQDHVVPENRIPWVDLKRHISTILPFFEACICYAREVQNMALGPQRFYTPFSQLNDPVGSSTPLSQSHSFTPTVTQSIERLSETSTPTPSDSFDAAAAVAQKRKRKTPDTKVQEPLMKKIQNPVSTINGYIKAVEALMELYKHCGDICKFEELRAEREIYRRQLERKSEG